jgi:hypothetical protein
MIVPMDLSKSGERLPFAVDGDGALFTFDPLAASFYLLTRYEEYLPCSTDHCGRYDGRQSLAFEEGFLRIPVIDRWVMWLQDALKDAYPALQFNRRGYRFTPTIDIDNAYAYRHKGLLLNLGGAMRSLLRVQGIGERLNVLLGNTPDPYDTYEEMEGLHASCGLRPLFFMLLADRGPHDRNLPHDHPAMRVLAKRLAANADMGIHPGVADGQSAQGIIKEKRRLETLINTTITSSRHHFIKISIPNTYMELIEAGITDDFSMGYPDLTGFRAGTSDSFLYYDLANEKVTGLRVHPFACMDVTLRGYLNLSPDEAIDEVAKLVTEVKATGGHLMTLWHNESIGDKGIWKGWHRVYRETLNFAKPL